MAANHVPTGQVPIQGQNIYSDPSYPNLLSGVDRYGTPSWEAQLHQSSGLVPATNNNQAWHHGSIPQSSFNSIAQPYTNQTHGYPSASPYQYGQFNQHNYAHTPNVDPSLGLDPNALRQQQQSPYQMPMRTTTPQNQSSTVTPQALQQNAAALQSGRPVASPFQIPKTTTEQFAQQHAALGSSAKPVRNPVYEIPKGRKSGGLYVLDQAALAKATKSNALNKFVTLGSEPLHLATNRTALPLYTARQSIRELKKAGAENKKILAKLSSSKSSALARALKPAKTNTGSPSSLKREVSDSEDYTDSSDDDSEYTDDEEDEPSPLPASRPDEPHQAVRYDIIKASWYPRRSALNSDQIKNSMRDLWEVLSTIQKRWRADSKAVTDAEEQKTTSELPVLKSRVASQRDLLQSALKAGLEYAHPDVLYHLGQVKPFLYLCYQFLANRFKAKEYDGPLSSVIYEILAQCGTLTTELIEETKVYKALVSMKKNASEKNKEFIQKVIDGAAAGTKKAKTSSPPASEPADTKSAKRPAPDSAARPAGEGPLAKKSKPAEPAARTTAPASKSAPATSGTSLQKKAGDKPAAAPAPIKARVNQVTNKSSSIFASLNAAAKKPATAATAPMAAKSGAAQKSTAAAAKDKKPAPAASKPAFSFAQTMASLTKPKAPEVAPTKSEKTPPNETPEEKAKRLRKESRRHLRVTFRPDASLVAIKYFSHDPEEEMGHDENFVRDAGDIGGEGHMFKQHKELDVDEEDEDHEVEFRPWIEPSPVDFSVVDAEERKRNYMPFGGGEAVPTCPEKEANIQRENTTLMVFYAHPSDIPASPAEPSEQSQEAAPVTATMFGTPPDLVLKRSPQTSVPMPTTDFSNLENIIKQFSTANSQPQATAPPAATYPTAYTPPPPAAPPIADLASLLSTLQAPAAFQPQATAPAPPPMPVQQAAPPSLDFNAIMSALQSGNAGALPPPPPGLPPGFPPGFPFAFPPQLPQQESAAYQPQPPAQPQYNQGITNGNKRQREESNHNTDRGGYGKKHKTRNDRPIDTRPPGDRPHKVLACKFYQKGTCNKGDNCTYIHDMNM